MRSGFIVAIGLLALSACTTATDSHPARTATEELLISAAADSAADRLQLDIPKGAKVFLDAGNFEGTDSKNAVAAIRSSLLKQGASMADDRKSAKVIVEIRAGALSTNEDTTLVGIPQFPIPIPFASVPLTFPEIALYKSEEQKGVAKFAAVSYAAKSGALLEAEDPQFGFSHDIKRTALFLISWEDTDIWPDDEKEREGK